MPAMAGTRSAKPETRFPLSHDAAPHQAFPVLDEPLRRLQGYRKILTPAHSHDGRYCKLCQRPSIASALDGSVPASF
jgi:hypothetical protein